MTIWVGQIKYVSISDHSPNSSFYNKPTIGFLPVAYRVSFNWTLFHGNCYMYVAPVLLTFTGRKYEGFYSNQNRSNLFTFTALHWII